MRATCFALLALMTVPASGATLKLEAKIPLPGGRGHIDHLAFDVEHRRLFVAELGNGSVAIVDVGKHRLERRLDGLKEPQGIAYYPRLRRLYVADGGDGIVHAYDTETFRETNRNRALR